MRMIFKILLFATFPIAAFAVDLGSIGQLYDIKERDLLEEIQERAANINWQNFIDKSKTDLQSKVGSVSLQLPKASENKTYYIDLTTTLDYPIYTRDRKGKPLLLYPKGYTFNVLNHTKLRKRFIFFDGTRPEEVAWFKDKYAKNLNAMPILSEGNALAFSKEIEREAYILDATIISRLKLKVSPTVVYQEGNQLRADEIYLPPLEEEDKKEINQ
ncbi:MAG: hypothetical protein IJD28_01635 [Deferribacterales bacterium]|nr:hypothetical protein [Deferribacterales bacterium]